MEYYLESPTCAGCNGCVVNEVRLKVNPNLIWHVECLACFECGKSLANDGSCFIKFGRVFCYEHYRKLFTTPCAICQQTFTKTDLVLPLNNDNYCHSKCINCAVCQTALTPGSKYHLIRSTIICANKNCLYFITSKHQINNSFYINTSQSPDSSFENYSVTFKDETTMDGEQFKSSNDDDETSESERSDESGNISSYGKPQGIKQKKVPRNRTVLTEKQLHILNTYYNMNPKPDALIKEQLVEVTGLKPRIIRVWFQNKRCKDKKKLISDEISKSKISDLLLNSEPMLVPSPLKLSPNLNPTQIQKVINHHFTDIDEIENHTNYFASNSSNIYHLSCAIKSGYPSTMMSSIASQNQFLNTARLH